MIDHRSDYIEFQTMDGSAVQPQKNLDCVDWVDMDMENQLKP